MKLESWYANSLVLLDLEQEFPSLERLIMEDRSMRRPNGPEETWSEIIIEDCRKFLHFDPYRKPSSDGPQFDDNISRLQHDATRSYELIYIYELRPHMPITGRLVEDFKMVSNSQNSYTNRQLTTIAVRRSQSRCWHGQN